MHIGYTTVQHHKIHTAFMEDRTISTSDTDTEAFSAVTASMVSTSVFTPVLLKYIEHMNTDYVKIHVFIKETSSCRNTKCVYRTGSCLCAYLSDVVSINCATFEESIEEMDVPHSLVAGENVFIAINNAYTQYAYIYVHKKRL